MKFELNKELIIQKLDSKTTIFSGEESVLLTLNETATYIFDKLKAGWDKEKITEGLIKIYRVPRIQAEKDVDDLLKNLIKRKILLRITQ